MPSGLPVASLWWCSLRISESCQVLAPVSKFYHGSRGCVCDPCNRQRKRVIQERWRANSRRDGKKWGRDKRIWRRYVDLGMPAPKRLCARCGKRKVFLGWHDGLTVANRMLCYRCWLDGEDNTDLREYLTVEDGKKASIKLEEIRAGLAGHVHVYSREEIAEYERQAH